jgi:adenine-specific DNA-methyltransferase
VAARIASSLDDLQQLQPSDFDGLSREELLALIVDRAEAGIRISFVGKGNARKLARLVRPRVQQFLQKYSAGSEESQSRNLVIEGDNLQAMVTLYKDRGQVDLVVADPPYNTGNDFRYNDHWDTDPNDQGLGELVLPDDGARHTKWMKFMWPRLQMMKAMLKPTGVLAICIDHRELFRLGQMLDELFGEPNRLAIINWQRSYTRTNDAAHIAVTTEYVLVYARDIKRAVTARLARIRAATDEWKNPDQDPDPWDDGPATGSNAKAHKGMVYGIQSPFTGTVFYPPTGSAWRQEQERNLRDLQGWGAKFELRDIDDEQERAGIIGIDPGEVPDAKAIMVAEPLDTAREKANKTLEDGIWPSFLFLRRGLGKPRLKKHLRLMRPGEVATTFWAKEEFEDADDAEALDLLIHESNAPLVVSWPHEFSGHSQQGVDELTDVVGPGHEFKTVKPLKLFEKIIELWCPSSGFVLDPFAGSGTTGHAVLRLNASAGVDRRFALVEQGRPDRGDSYARSLLAVRLQRVISGEWAKGKNSPLGGGYRFVTLTKKVDAEAVLRMERAEMTDTVVASYFDPSRRRSNGLIMCASENFRYLVARNSDHEGFYLVWDGPDSNIDLTAAVYEEIAAEAAAEGLRRTYHVYARFNLYQTENVNFYQIPDRILADFGLDVRTDAFNEPED